MARRGKKRRARRDRELLEAVEGTFRSRARRGTLMTDGEIAEVARKKGVSPPPTEEETRRFRSHFAPLVRFGDQRTPRPAAYQTIVATPPLTYQVDVAFMTPAARLKRLNDGNFGFLLAVEVHSKKAAAVPMRRKDEAAFEEAILALLQTTAVTDVQQLQSDAEPVLVSERFARKMRRQYGIDFVYLRTRSKAAVAERMIRTVKTRLSTLMKLNATERWLDFLVPTINQMNRQPATSDGLKRKDVTAENVERVVLENVGGAGAVDLPSLRATASVSGTSLLEETANRVFKFDLGQAVLVSRKVLEPDRKFRKASIEGQFGEGRYVVAERRLARTRRMTMVPGECIKDERLGPTDSSLSPQSTG